mmetsp:Transcript_57037/g.94823  ORF Transcript_57037/g.94823 Transcript_57037/m.94823 type:complete len:359 (-) Transcript_57037:240-1316(-)
MAEAFETSAPLRLQICSDLHLEFYMKDGSCRPPRVTELLKPTAPVLALLGDISLLDSETCASAMEDFLRDSLDHFEVVLLLLGNHEYYTQGRSRTVARDIIAKARRICAAASARVGSAKEPPARCFLLENEAVTIAGVRVAGTTLWSRIHQTQTVEGAIAADKVPQRCVEYCLRDFYRIYTDEAADGTKPEPLSADQVNVWHESAASFLASEAEKCTAACQPMVILTHHAPSFKTMMRQHAEEARSDGFGCGFATDLEWMLAGGRYRAIHSWCFGHTHSNVDMTIGQVRVVSNQRGYVHELSENYREDCVLEVPSDWSRLKAETAAAAELGHPPNSCAVCEHTSDCRNSRPKGSCTVL